MQLTDRGAVALAVCAWMGAWWHRPVAVVAMVAVIGVTLAFRRPLLLVAAVGVVASGLAARSYSGLQPIEPGSCRQVVTLVSDPVASSFGWRADVRIDGRRVELRAADGAGGALSRALTGERIWVEGRLAPPRPNSPWLVPRHVVGRLSATVVERVGSGAVTWRAANRVRRLLQEGSASMGEPQRSLYGGFVLGDDRNQAPEIVDDFRGAGLTHLLVVSGQNVGFVLVLVSPLTARLGWRGRWTATVAVILAFGIITRFEPSVLRASAMAAVAVTAGAVGRPSGSVRTLAVAVTGVILIDPLLVRSVSFQLSVGASLAIALFAARIATIIPGPRGFADALGVTMAAQFGVAPVLVPLTGGLPVVSLVANPLAVPVAGLVTTWGLPAGAIAGLAGPVVAAVIHTPTDLMITWVALVARWSAGLPLGAVGWPHLALLGLAAAIASRVPSVRGIAAIVAFATLAAPAIALRSEPGVVDPAASISLYRSNGATVVVTNGLTRPLELLEVMRTRGVRRVDVLVIAGARGAEVDRVVRHRWKVGRTLDAATTGPTRLRVGDLVVTVVPSAAPAVVVRPP